MFWSRSVHVPIHTGLLLWYLIGPSRARRREMIGKLRRHYLVYFRPKKVEKMLEKRTGACTRCGVCCQLGFACAHFDPQTRLCTVHECKPTVCRTFPLDFRDIADRDLQNPNIPCGFKFPESERK